MKKSYDCALGEPWSSAQRALETYANEMRSAPVHDVARICNKNGPLMADITKKLPKNVTPRIFQGGSTTNLPYSAPELSQVLLKNLQTACRTEIVLAPPELQETTAQFSSLVGAELAVCQLCELLDEATTESASFLEELAVADSMERINGHIHHLTEVVKTFSAELTHLYPDWDSILSHFRFMKDVGMMAARSSIFMTQILSAGDPLLSPATRLKGTAEALVKAAVHAIDKCTHLKRFDTGIGDARAPKGMGFARKSMIGLLANQNPGTTNFLLPSETRRRKRIDAKMKRRRARGGDHSSDEDDKVGLDIEEQTIAHAKCKACDTFYRDDSVFCHKCGNKRPDPPFASQHHVRDAGPPALKNVNEDVQLDAENESEDGEFLDGVLGRPPGEGPHSIWGGDAVKPAARDVEPRFVEGGGYLDYASDDEPEGHAAAERAKTVARAKAKQKAKEEKDKEKAQQRKAQAQHHSQHHHHHHQRK